MVKNHVFRFLVSNAQMEQIKIEAKAKGYVSVSHYIRDLALKRNQFIEEKILENNQNIKKILELLENG